MIKREFDIEQVVYLKNDKEQLPRFVTAYMVRKDSVEYELRHADLPVSWHYDYEISTNIDTLTKVT